MGGLFGRPTQRQILAAVCGFRDAVPENLLIERAGDSLSPAHTPQRHSVSRMCFFDEKKAAILAAQHTYYTTGRTALSMHPNKILSFQPRNHVHFIQYSNLKKWFFRDIIQSRKG
jgi:hypothetical protein